MFNALINTYNMSNLGLFLILKTQRLFFQVSTPIIAVEQKLSLNHPNVSKKISLKAKVQSVAARF